jgi:hypothetical protein
MCWSDDYFFAVLRFSPVSFLVVCILVFLSRGVVSRLLVQFCVLDVSVVVRVTGAHKTPLQNKALVLEKYWTSKTVGTLPY